MGTQPHAQRFASSDNRQPGWNCTAYNLEHNGAVGLGGLLHILLDLLDCPIMCNILLQHEVKSLTDTGCFYSLHNTVFALKINM